MTLDRRSLALAFALGALAVAFFGLRPKPTPGPPMRDFESYWAAGRTQTGGRDPYGRGVWRYQRTIDGVVATRDEVLPFVGPPYGLPFWQLLARLPFETAILVWGAVLALAAGTIAFGSLAVAGRRVDRIDALAMLVLCAAFGPLTSGLGLGQVAVLATAAVVAATLVARRSGTLLAASAFVAALQPNLALALVPLVSKNRFLPLAVAAVTALAVATLQPFGGLGRYLTLLREHGDAERFIAIQTTFAGVARGFGAPAAFAAGVGSAAFATIVALVYLQCRRRERPLDERIAIACAAVPLGLPFAHEHDFTLVLVAAVYAIRRARGRSFDLAAIGTLLVAVDWLGLAQRPTGVVECAGLALAAGFALTALAPEPHRDAASLGSEPRNSVARAVFARSAWLAVVPVVLLFGALTHRLSTWPDALARTYHASPAWTITAVWFDEQRESGIAALDPWWAMLRALSLAGCALVWYAVLRTGREARAEPSQRPLRASRPAPVPSSPALPPRSGPPSTPPRPVSAANPSSSRRP